MRAALTATLVVQANMDLSFRDVLYPSILCVLVSWANLPAG